MATTNHQGQASVGTGGEGEPRGVPADGGQPTTPRPSTEDVWRHVAKASFAILSQVTPAGEPRSSGVLYKSIGRRLYVVVAPDSWKASQIAASPRVAMTVPVRRGGVLSLVAPIPPATISFHAAAIVHPPGSMAIPEDLASLVPAERNASSCIIEIVPEGTFVTYGVGVSLLKMRTPATARARVPVTQDVAKT